LIVCYKKCVGFFDIKTTKCLKLMFIDNDDEEFYGVDYNELGLIGIVKSNSI